MPPVYPVLQMVSWMFVCAVAGSMAPGMHAGIREDETGLLVDLGFIRPMPTR